MRTDPHRLAKAWLLSFAVAACTPTEPAVGLVSNPNVFDTASINQSAADSDAAEVLLDQEAGPQDVGEMWLDAAESVEIDIDAALPDGYTFDATQSDVASAPDVPVFDSVSGYDQLARGDLGQRYDPDVWQELPSPSDVSAQADVGSDAAPDLATDAVPDTGADAPADQADSAVDASGPDDSISPVDIFDAADEAGASSDGAADSAAEIVADAPPEVVTDIDTQADTTPDAAMEVAYDADASADAGQVDSDADSDADSDSVADADTGPTCTANSCDDGEPCTVDSCSVGGNCTHFALPTATACMGGSCQQGICSRNTPALAGTSCKQLMQSTAGAQTGVWWLDPDGPFGVWQPYAVWCDMVAEGGGWTLLLKVLAAGELGYDSPLWTSITTLNPGHPRLDEQEGKFDSYWSVPHSELRIGMHVGNQVAWLVLPLQATSLFHLIKDDKPLTTALPTAKWLGLLPGTKMQDGCQAQGLNIDPGKGKTALYNYARVRIGLVGNAESDCQTPDSRIGLGGAGGTCGQSAAMTCGNAAGCFDGALTVNQPAIGYVLAR